MEVFDCDRTRELEEYGGIAWVCGGSAGVGVC